jgi:predicted ATP-grasp superfamily ATP-dependent carboligase
MINKTGAIIIEGHVQGLSNTRSLGEAGIPVYVVDKKNCIAKYSKYCQKFFRCPDFIDDEFAEFLVDLAIKENIRGWVLIPSNDHAVYTISKFKQKLEEYYKVITPGLNIVERIYDKVLLLELARQFGVPIPETQCFINAKDTIAQPLTFPLITKGRNGLSFYRSIRKKALLAHDDNELRSQLKLIESKYQIDKTFTQELIPYDGTNKTISFTAFCIHGEVKVHWTGVKLREHPLQFGTATFTRSVICQECYEQSIPLLRALNYTGVCEIEYLFDPRDKQYKLIEINARTWLWVGLAKACGIDYAMMIYHYANDLPFSYPKNYLIGRSWINPVSDSVYAIQAILKGKLKVSAYLSSIFAKSHHNALFAKNDWLPGFAYFFQVFHFIRKR